MITEIYKELYKKDSKGRIRKAIISTENGTLTKKTGLIDGQLVTKSSFRPGKNKGKKNETTSQQQAILEAESDIRKKLREGYHETEAEANSEKSWKPMLAKSYDNEKDKVTFPCIVQPKLDGIRAVYKTGGSFVSRKNKEITTMDHITSQLPDNLPFHLDGELYVHGTAFQDVTSLIKKKVKDSDTIEYHIYDVMIEDKDYSKRENHIQSVINNLDPSVKVIKVPSYTAHSHEEIETLYNDFIQRGYEGAMVRWGSEGYRCDSRTSYLLKYKTFIDEVYELIDVTPTDKDPTQGVPVCKLNFLLPLTTEKISWYKVNGEVKVVTDKNGVECGYPTTRCGAKLSQDQRRDLLKNKNKYIGKMAEVRFFEKSNKGIPRFPIYHGIRIDK